MIKIYVNNRIKYLNNQKKRYPENMDNAFVCLNRLKYQKYLISRELASATTAEKNDNPDNV